MAFNSLLLVPQTHRLFLVAESFILLKSKLTCVKYVEVDGYRKKFRTKQISINWELEACFIHNVFAKLRLFDLNLRILVS